MSGPERTSRLGEAPAIELPGTVATLPPEPVPPAPARGVWAEPLFWVALALACTRLFRLGAWSLWEDEVFTLSDARAMLESGALSGPKSPLGYALFAGLIGLLGPVPGEAGLRLLPALLGIAGIAACGLCFAPVFGARRAAAAALLVAASTWHLYWSQNARFYTLAQDLALLGGACALRALLRPRGEKFALWALWALALTLLAALAHPSAALLFPAWLAAGLVLARASSSGWAAPRLPVSRAVQVGGGLLAVAVAAWLVPVWLDFYRTKHDPTVGHLLLTSGWYFTPALLAAAAFGAWRGARARSAPDALVAVVCLSAAGLALFNALFVRAAAQYLFVLLPFVAVLATRPLQGAERARAPRWWRAAWLAALCVPGLADQVLYFGVRNGDRPRWKEAFAEVARRSAPGDLVFTNNANVGEFYFAPRSDGLRHPTHVHNLDRYSFTAERHWARQPRRAWFVVNQDRLLEWPSKEREAFEAMLASNARRVAEFPLDVGVRDLDVLVYLRE